MKGCIATFSLGATNQYFSSNPNVSLSTHITAEATLYKLQYQVCINAQVSM